MIKNPIPSDNMKEKNNNKLLTRLNLMSGIPLTKTTSPKASSKS